MAKQISKSDDLLATLRNNPIWSPPLDAAIAEVRSGRDDFEDYVKLTFSGRKRKHGIVVGAPGTGKSYGVARIAKNLGLREGTIDDQGRYDFTVIKGSVSPSFLHVLLYWHRKPGKVLVFDDCKTIEHDTEALTAINSVADTTNPVVTRASMRELVGIPSQFKFEGRIFIISNTFSPERANTRRNSVREHRIGSITDRIRPFPIGNDDHQTIMAHLIDLAATERIFANEMAADDATVAEVILWMVENLHKFKTLSIRHMMDIMDYRLNPIVRDWRRMAARVCTRSYE